MVRKALLVAAATLMTSGPVLAQHSNMGHDNRAKARQKSQGPHNASERGIERANENSVLHGARAGMEVRDRNGRRVGQVREVRRAPDGTVIAIVVVLVVAINGSNVITLPAGSFTIINNIVVINQINF